jgi:hypothetical protein
VGKPELRNVDPEEARILGIVIGRLTRLIECTDEVVLGAVDDPVPGSPKDKAASSDLDDAYGYVRMVMASADDHLRTIRLVVTTGPLPMYALYTLLRAAAEAIVRVRHLVDPDITEVERLARGMNERLDNLDEQRKVAADQQPHYDERVAFLEAKAAINGIAIRRAKSKDGAVGKVIGIDSTISTDFDLFSKYIDDGSTIYRVLCGHVHSKQWVQMLKSAAKPSADPKVLLVNPELRIRTFAFLLDVVLDLYQACVGYWLVLAGYPSNLFELALGPSATHPSG